MYASQTYECKNDFDQLVSTTMQARERKHDVDQLLLAASQEFEDDRLLQAASQELELERVSVCLDDQLPTRATCSSSKKCSPWFSWDLLMRFLLCRNKIVGLQIDDCQFWHR